MNFFASPLKIFLLATLFSLFSLGAQAATDDAKAATLAKQNACLGCHAVDKKIVGPGFQAVAKKYANDPGATVFLKNKILKGGSGSWGVVPMPANAKLSDADVSLLASWILRGAPSAN
ncbi:cytochrome c, class I [Polynucleobacter asymbioticus]|uniref:c-type cytochrome n=1 Tax=Polynucleobacter asymbioticus TaxID=576611 RepID=UPI001BFDFF09|nr:c-type cytochrome [Polynucleobacter asymbioticus]QWD85347.1 cytochrome c, class I [Polynucleobacter asymbioticus]